MTATKLALLFVLGLTLSAAPGALDATGGKLSMVAAAYLLGVLMWPSPCPGAPRAVWGVQLIGRATGAW